MNLSSATAASPNTLLNFGEGEYPVRGGAGAIGYLVGKPGEGLRCMFHMMNEARIAVGLGATMLGYAATRPASTTAQPPAGPRDGALGQDPRSRRSPSSATPTRRMLLAQKSWCEGLALALYCARLVDELHTGAPGPRPRQGAAAGVLTPIASWPSREWCLEANSLAIHLHGGYGYRAISRSSSTGATTAST